MPLVKNNILASDPWHHADDDTPLLPDTPATVSLPRWHRDREAILRSGMDIGLRMMPDEKIHDIVDDLKFFAIIILNFPIFTDGRAYSQARLLRDRYAFTGEIRARGDILFDQIQMMTRSGFDAFDVKKLRDAKYAADALREINIFYQPAADGDACLYKQRRTRRRQAAAAE